MTGARGIPGRVLRVTCRGRLRLEGVGLEQRHRVNRDGRDDRDDGVDDETLRRIGVVRGAALLGAASFAVVRREARPAVELDAGTALRRVAAVVALVGLLSGSHVPPSGSSRIKLTRPSRPKEREKPPTPPRQDQSATLPGAVDAAANHKGLVLEYICTHH